MMKQKVGEGSGFETHAQYCDMERKGSERWYSTYVYFPRVPHDEIPRLSANFDKLTALSSIPVQISLREWVKVLMFCGSPGRQA
jgi:hypothetical protein